MCVTLLGDRGCDEQACLDLRRKKTFPKVARSSKALDDRMRAKWGKDLPKGF
jgi:hypothetical protein